MKEHPLTYKLHPVQQSYLVLQSSTGSFDYRTLSGAQGRDVARISGAIIAETLIRLREAVQCWIVEADDGNKAITLVKQTRGNRI